DFKLSDSGGSDAEQSNAESESERLRVSIPEWRKYTIASKICFVNRPSFHYYWDLRQGISRAISFPVSAVYKAFCRYALPSIDRPCSNVDGLQSHDTRSLMKFDFLHRYKLV